MTVPYMPLYIADYQADTGHLTTAEHGAYLLLIMTYWQRGDALPDDDRKLARIARMGPREWSRVRETISEFFEVSGGTWFHSRIHSELDKLHAKSLIKRKGGLARAKQMHNSCSAGAKLIVGVGEDIPLDKSNGADDPSKAFWDSAKSYLGKSKSSLIGKLCGEYGNAAVTSAITTAMLASPQPPDRAAYVIGILRKQGAPGAFEYTGGPC